MPALTRRLTGAAVCTATVVATFATGVPSALAKDHSAPSSPGSVAIDGKTTSSSHASLKLSWKKPSAKDLRGVTVWRNSKDKFSTAKKVKNLSTHTSYSDAKVTPGHTYWYYVAAYDKSGNRSPVIAIAVAVSPDTSTRQLAGVVTDTDNTRLHDVDVDTSRGSGDSYGDDESTDNSGMFATTGVPYAADGVSVCADPEGTQLGGDSSTGYVAQCYAGKPGSDPKHATRLKLVAGEFRAITLSLSKGAELSGTVDGSGAAALGDADVTLFDADGDEAQETSTNDAAGDDGTPGGYDFPGLQPGGHYTVLIDASDVDDSTNTYGYVSQWVGGAAANSYTAGNAAPSGVTTFTLSGGHHLSVPTVHLAQGGGISGTVDGSTGGDVRAYDAAGNTIARINFGTDSDSGSGDTFALNGLAAGSYTVCADDFEGDAPPECWNGTTGVTWDGDPSDFPSGTVGAVSVTSGADHSGLAFTLHQPGSVSGTVTGATADVTAYDADGNEVNDATTSSGGGTYQIADLPAGSYTVCAADTDDDTEQQCWNGTTGVTWDGDTSHFPTGTQGATTVTDATDTPNVNFAFSG